MNSVIPVLSERRWSAAVAFIVVGGAAITAAGVVSAATAFAPSYLASWAVAFLVLVAGVAQVTLGIGQALLASRLLARTLIISEVLLFNLGCAGVLLGQLLALRVFTVLGSLLLVASLALLFRATWGSAPEGRSRLLLFAFRAVLLILLISIPVGLFIARNSG